MWYRGRSQRRESPILLSSHKRVIAWSFIGQTVPFLVLFLGAEWSDLNIFEAFLSRNFYNPVFIIFGILTFGFGAAFMFYIFFRNGAEELVSLQPIIRVQPARWNTKKFWKILAILVLPLQLAGFYWVYYFSAELLPPVGG